MTKPMVREHNLETNEIIDREMTDAEHSVYLAEQQEIADQEAAAIQAALDKAALLEKLGITAEEAKLLLS
jgi:hypothetical protein